MRVEVRAAGLALSCIAGDGPAEFSGKLFQAWLTPNVHGTEARFVQTGHQEFPTKSDAGVTFSRELLMSCLNSPSGSMDIRMQPCLEELV